MSDPTAFRLQHDHELAVNLEVARDQEAYWKGRGDAIKAEILRRHPNLLNTQDFKFSLHQSVQVKQEEAWRFLNGHPELRAFFRLSMSPADFERMPDADGFAALKASPMIRVVKKKEAA